MNKLIKLTGVSLVALSAALYVSSISKVMAEDITKNSDLNGFSKISLNVSSDIKISMGKNYSIVLTGDDERIGNTKLEVKNDTLKISHEKRNMRYDRDQKMLITVVMPNIEAMRINGSGDGEITGVDNKSLVLQINGAGDLDVSGKTESLDIGINGSGDIRMDEVDGKDVKVSINGSGDVELDGGSCSTLEIDIRGSGDVSAKNMQCNDVNVDVSGSGDSAVFASNKLTFDSHGSGNVDVYGKPKTVLDNEARRRSRIRIR